jgi:ATP-binding cassette, subfamily B, bacterial
MATQTGAPPLARLLRHAGRHRGRVRLGATFSVLNKLFDLAPPLLIGAAVDIVVEREESFLARFGYGDPHDQFRCSPP